MPKVGNYVQRDYHNRYSSKRKSKWTSYNKGWAKKRSNSIQKSQTLRNQLSSTVATISIQTVQQQAAMTLQNRYTPQSTYANATAVAARVNVLI